jgi:hypothetical protein
MHVEQRSVGWSLWFQWLIANSIGGLVGLALMAETPSFLVGYFGSGGDPTNTAGYSAVWAVILGATLGGATIGGLQWFILRRQNPAIKWWTVASTAGFALGFILVWALSGAASGKNYAHHALPHAVDRAGIVGGLVIGAMMGSVQSLFLRWNRKRVAYWVGANIVGFSVGWFGAAAQPVTGVPAHFVGGATFGCVFGAITGIVLVWLLRHPAHSAQET